MLVSTKLNLRNVVNIAKNVYYAKPYTRTPLGRWNICETKNINLVVDYANEDHCGACSSQYTLEIRNKSNKKNESGYDIYDHEHTYEHTYEYEYECLLTNSHS